MTALGDLCDQRGARAIEQHGIAAIIPDEQNLAIGTRLEGGNGSREVRVSA